MHLREEFKIAIKDYLFLLNKGYPQKASLKLVGDRYKLKSEERSILFRGVMPDSYRQIREIKRVSKVPESGLLAIDGFNVLRTVASYFLGRPVYIAMDGFLRDASELHGKPLKLEVRERALRLVLNTIKGKFVETVFWLDSPVSYSGETAKMIKDVLKEYNIKGTAVTVHSADFELKKIDKGIIATADSAVIENSIVPVVDLAQLTIFKNFNPDLLDLRRI